MADRKASVALELKAGQFKAEATVVEEKIRGVDREVDKLDRDITKIPADAAKAGAAMKLLQGDVRGVSAQIGNIGDKSAAMEVLDARIKKSRDEVKKLVEEFEKTGDVEVFKKLGKASADKKNLENIRKDLAKSIEDGLEEGGKGGLGIFSSLFQNGIKSTFESLPPEAKAAVVAVIGAAALAAIPVVVSAIDAALLLGLGGGGLIAGITLAAKDANVAKVYEDLGHHIMGSLQKAVTPFRSELVGAAGIFQASWDKITPNVQRSFNTLSKAIQPLASGLGRALENAAPGLEKAFQGALPILQELGDVWLPKIGQDLGDLGMALARAEPEADFFFKFLMANVDIAIKAITFLTNGVHDLTGALMLITGQYQPLSPALADDTSAMAELGDASKSTKEDIASIGDAFSQLGQSAEGALTGKILDSMFALDDATLKWHESLNKLNDKIDKNGTSLDVNTDKGIKNAKMLEAAAKANADLYQQNLLSGMSADEAGAAYERNAATLRKQAVEAGFNAKEVDNLIGKYAHVPTEVQTILSTIGLTNALDHLAQILTDFRLLNDKEFKTKYTVSTFYVTHYGTVGGKEGPGKYAYGGVRRKAAQGMFIPSRAPGSVLVGEPSTAPGEMLIPLGGVTRNRAMDLTQAVGDRYGFSVTPNGGRGGSMRFEHTFTFSSNVDTVMGSAITKLFRTGDAQVTTRAIVS